MNFSVKRADGYSIIKIETDKLGGVLSPELKASFIELKELGEKNIILDLSNVRYCDSSGLSAVLVGNRLCKNENGVFVLCELSEMVAKLVQISQLNSVLNITPTEKEAIDFLLMDKLEKDINNE
jgi:anti-anti-sigma factor